jgi:uncharacterized protein YbjT (DUF2867 family)
MNTMKIAIAAATGNIGRQAAKQISRLGGTPLLLGRNLAKLNELQIPGAISREVDLSHTQQVVQATQGAEALLWLVPPAFDVANLKDWYQRVMEAGLAAVQENSIKRVVLISSLGAGSAHNQGTVTYTGQMEIEFDKLEAQVLVLRPGYFMENFLLQAQTIQAESEFSFTYEPKHDIPFISTDDIANAAAGYLMDPTWAGHWKLNLMGPENITLEEAAVRLSGLTGKQIRYKQISMAEAIRQIGDWGANPMIQQEFADLMLALGDRDGPYATPRTPEAYTPTTFDQFVLNKLLPIL